jgi:hypothetical protein
MSISSRLYFGAISEQQFAKLQQDNRLKISVEPFQSTYSVATLLTEHNRPVLRVRTGEAPIALQTLVTPGEKASAQAATHLASVLDAGDHIVERDDRFERGLGGTIAIV